MEIWECKPKCSFSYWNTWVLVFQDKNQRQKEYKNDNVFCGIELSRAIVARGLSKYTGSFLRKTKEIVLAFRYNHTILNVSNPISSFL